MTARLAHLLRHPIKSVGHEALAEVELTEGQALPFDRHWAVTHEASKFAGAWAPKMNFVRGVAGPELMAVTASLDEASGRIVLRHPSAGALDVVPGTADDARLIDWLRLLWPENRPAPAAVVSAPDHAMTDRPEPFLALLNMATLDDLSAHTGRPMSVHRFRGNLWIDGWQPWAEFELIGRRIRIGAAEVLIDRRITRCEATSVNPETGAKDTDTLATLRDTWGHQDFGTYVVVTRSGRVAVGDPVEVLE